MKLARLKHAINVSFGRFTVRRRCILDKPLQANSRPRINLTDNPLTVNLLETANEKDDTLVSVCNKLR